MRRFSANWLRLSPALAALIGLMILATALRVHDLANVPPGVHYDEIINGEIAAQARAEGFRLFYLAGWGREGLYHALLAASRAAPLPVHWQMRLPSVLASLVGLLLTFGWVRRAFGAWTALGAVAGMAVAFWTVALGRAALRATTVLPLTAAAAWLLVTILEPAAGRTGDVGTASTTQRYSRNLLWKCLALALTLGLSVYTYRAARVFPAVLVVFLLYLVARRRPYPRCLWLSVAGSLLVAAPLALFLLTHPGAEQRVGQVDRPWQELLDGRPRPVLEGALSTAAMFGIRGDRQSHYNLADRPVFEPFGALLFYLGLGLAVARWRRPVYAFCLIWLTIGLAPGSVTEPAPHFVHTVVAQPVAFVFPGLCLSFLAHWTTKRWGRPGTWLAALALVGWTAGGAYLTYRAYFVAWPQTPQVRAFHQSGLLAVARHLEASAADTPVAVCSGFLNESDPFWRTGRQSLPYFLNRTNLPVRWYDCASTQVWPDGGRPSRFFFLGDTDFPEWVPDDWLAAALPLPVTGPGARGVELTVAAALDDHLAGLDLAPDWPSPVSFGGRLRFLGFNLDSGHLEPGGAISLWTYWSVLQPLPQDLAVFVHLTDGDEALLAQGDALALLSDTLRPGDIIIQSHTLALPPDLGPEFYPLTIGVYSRRGEFPPLPITDGGPTAATRLLIATLAHQP